MGARRALLGLVGVLVLYFAVPVSSDVPLPRLALSVLGALVGAGVVVTVVLRELGRHLRGEEEGLTFVRLLLLFEVVALAFAFSYYVLATNTVDQFAGIETRVDALYFMVITAATVGYGDAHATGQAARVVVTINVVFNIVFLGVLAHLATGRLSQAKTGPGGDPSGRSDEQ